MWLKLLALAGLAYVGAQACSRVYRYVKSMSDSPPVTGSQSPAGIDDMVKDPVCGVYVPCRSAVTMMQGDKPIFFCSEECRDKYGYHG